MRLIDKDLWPISCRFKAEFQASKQSDLAQIIRISGQLAFDKPGDIMNQLSNGAETMRKLFWRGTAALSAHRKAALASARRISFDP